MLSLTGPSLSVPVIRVQFWPHVTVSVEFAHSPHVCVGLLPDSKDVRVKLIGHAKL